MDTENLTDEQTNKPGQKQSVSNNLLAITEDSDSYDDDKEDEPHQTSYDDQVHVHEGTIWLGRRKEHLRRTLHRAVTYFEGDDVVFIWI